MIEGRHAAGPLRFNALRLQSPSVSVALFFALYCLEAGLFFTIVPWTRIWTMNPLLHGNMALGLWADNPFVRGFISGFGVIHLIIGVKDIIRISRERRSSPEQE
jgi:hypothetical protein